MMSRLKYRILSVIVLTALITTGGKIYAQPSQFKKFGTVKVGADVLLQKYLPELKGKRVGLVMNPTSRVHGVHMLDTLLSRGVHVTALFAPEHGFRGNHGAGEHISNGIDQATGLPVYSLYGKTRKPTPAMLKNVDLLIFDMQDVGARFYTFISTMGYVIEAAADQNIPLWILDRPDPAGGNYIGGWIREPKYKTFVGEYPIPMAYGMTMGELAKMMVGEHWLKTKHEPKIRVIKCVNWKRSMLWPQTKLRWYPTSPNLPHFENAFVYLGTCLFEGTTFSAGRGTDNPFLIIGSPYLKLTKDDIKSLMAGYPVQLKLIQFTPRSIPGKSLHPKYENQLCHGVKIYVPVGKMHQFDPVAFGHDLLKVLLNHSQKDHIIPYLYDLTGTKRIDAFLLAPLKVNPVHFWAKEDRAFRKERRKYLLYH